MIPVTEEMVAAANTVVPELTTTTVRQMLDAAMRISEASAMAMVEDYVKTLPGQQLSSSERFTLFDVFRERSNQMAAKTVPVPP